MIDANQLKDFALTAQQQIDGGSVEDMLRHLLSARLPLIFPDNPWWIQAHVLGTEAHVHFANEQGNSRTGFADSIVGKTAIEYEKNLNNRHIFDEGYHQVEEYCAALCNLGISESEIYGVLSDTVRWYGYKISVDRTNTGNLLGANNITLIQEDVVDLSIDPDSKATQFELFVNKYLGRDESRILNAKTLVLDFGMDGEFYRNNINLVKTAVVKAMQQKPDYSELIKNVWQNFVAYLGASEYGSFSIDTYVNEYYLVTVAKLICANVMQGKPIISSRQELKAILNGRYFTQNNIQNLVDYDYFGWLNEEPFVDDIVDVSEEIQKRLVAYDFKYLGEQDLFGELLAQLASKEHRLLLGQEFTPHWVAGDIVCSTLENNDEIPRILDMCCGSGIFLIEAVKRVRELFNITPENYSSEKDDIVFDCVMGFDIDPLAVMLAKVNWVLAMRDLFSVHTGTIVIPIYHADSLFVATPISHTVPDTEEEYYNLHFYGKNAAIPAFIITPEYRRVFDAFMAKCYRIAMVRAKSENENLSAGEIEALIGAVKADSGVNLDSRQLEELSVSAFQLISTLEALQREGKNGIWFFVLSNSYRPGLTTEQFNYIVSNPPWLAMSKLADNPYKTALLEKAASFGIKPKGASHPHMELATTFLISAVDKYLRDGASWSCIMPGSIMSGYNHEPLRKEDYRNSDHPVDLQITGLWELPRTTFKNKAVVLSGKKTDERTNDILTGREYLDDTNYSVCQYTLNTQGRRSAWTNRGNTTSIVDTINVNPIPFNQGADVFPRTALFHDFSQQPNGKWKIEQIQKTSDLYYLINDSKKSEGANIVASDFDGEYLYDCLISKHLSPFYVADPAKAIIPGKKTNGTWTIIRPTDYALMNSSTEYVFSQIEQETAFSAVELLNRVNIYEKLFKQRFSNAEWLVLSSASGSNPCAAYMHLGTAKDKLVIDQTLYWHIAESEEEAIYLVGMLNSRALADAISDFQPQGEFGKRHIHTLPYKVIANYEGNQCQLDVVDATRNLIEEWKRLCRMEKYATLLLPNSGALNSRRKRQQDAIKGLDSYELYEAVCASML